MPKRAGAILLATLNFCQVVYADPWFTGPLLAPPAQTVARGQINVIFEAGPAISNSIYNQEWQRVSQTPFTSTQISPQFLYGMADNIDIQYSGLYVINQSNGLIYEHMGDSSVALGYQALSQHKNNAWPDLRITLEEILPIGLYNGFTTLNSGAESTGMGSYQTALGLNFQYLSPLNQDHYLYSHLSITYTYAANTTINGLSSYGGTIDTRGSINPGNAISLDLAGEFTLTQKLVAVMEANFIYQQASKFHGEVGQEMIFPVTPTNPHSRTIGSSVVGNGHLDQITLAPALEYNFSINYGVIAGVWFTIAGKNTPHFVTPLIQFTATW